MYKRDTNSGHAVEWRPDNENLVVHAMELTPETGVPTHVNLPDEANVPVEDAGEADDGTQVAERYGLGPVLYRELRAKHR